MPEPNVTGPIRCLVVDDDEDTRVMLSMLLTSHGWTVTVARSGEEALGLFERCAPDLVLADIGMPEMDGYELVGRLRSAAARAFAAIAVTGYASADEARRAVEAGFDAHLAKPFTFVELMELVREVTGGRP